MINKFILWLRSGLTKNVKKIFGFIFTFILGFFGAFLLGKKLYDNRNGASGFGSTDKAGADSLDRSSKILADSSNLANSIASRNRDIAKELKNAGTGISYAQSTLSDALDKIETIKSSK